MFGYKFVFLMFGKCPFLLRWNKVLSISHALGFHFIRNNSVTRKVISINRLFIIQYISGKCEFFPLHDRYSWGHYLAPHTNSGSLEWQRR